MNPTLRSLTACLCLLSAPDILPDYPVKAIASATRLDLGPFADQVCVAYEVQKGDTLTAIAKVQFGDAARTADIASCNPTIEPDRLRIGQRLWLPPRDKATKDPAYVFLNSQPGRAAEPCVVGQDLPRERLGYTIYLVTKSHIDAFVACHESRAQQRMAVNGTIVMLSAPGNPTYVEKESPIARITTTIRLAKDAAGKPTATTTRVCFDKNEKQLDAALLEKKTPPREPKKELLMLLLALAGGTWLWQRARSAAPQPHVALHGV